MISAICPDGRRLQALLDEGAAGDDVDELARHLDSCPTCQQTLQELAAPPDAWASTVRGLMDQSRTETTLQYLVERLKEEAPLPTEDDGLSFLKPTDKPGVLGLLDRYEVQEEIGRGGMGVVLKALDPSLNRIVAIKVLSPALASSATARRRFVREGKAAAAVCHDHIVTVYGVDATEGLPYLVMQYVAGESLQFCLDRTGSLPVDEVVRIGFQTTTGLAAAHAQGLIHRDIKPANLLLENGGARVKITDFGLARMADDVGLTQDGVIAGTPAYMAPEQARGEVVDHRADLFSLGSVLYACCAGVPPFRGSTAMSVLLQVSGQEPMPLRSLNPEVPAWLEALIARLMRKDPAERFQSAAEVAALLEGYLAHLRQPATIQHPPLPPSPQGNEPAVLVSPPGRAASWLLPILWIAVMLVLPASLAWWQGLAGVDAPPAPKAVSPELYFDFRSDKQPPPSLTVWSGTDGTETIEPEDKGLRISLPVGRKLTYPVGLVMRTTVQGNFEITAGYEIVRADTPRTGNGVGYELYVTMDSPTRDAIGFSQVKDIDGRDQYVCARMTTVNGARKYIVQTFPANGRSGRLRLTRQGEMLLYLVAEGDAADFRELWRFPLPSADVNAIRMGAYQGQAPEAVEVRLVDVRVHSNVPISVPSADGDVDGKLTKGTKKGRSLLVILGLGLTLALAAFLVWLLRFRGSKSAVKEQDGKDGSEPHEDGQSAVPALIFACSSCGKRLRTKAELCGKKVKCPQCGKPVAVPLADSYTAEKPEPRP